MEIQISGRGADLPAELRRRAAAQVGRAARFVPKATEARVVLALERHRHRAEVTVQAKGTTLHAEGEGDDFRGALDVAVDSLAEQARRRKERLRARTPRPARRARPAAAPAGATVTEAAAGPADQPLADQPIVRRLAAKPMSVDEALEQMRTRRDGLLVFTNAKTRAVNVLHRRPDGQLELVQPTG